MVYEDPVRDRRLWASIRKLAQAAVTSSAMPEGFVRRELPMGQGQVDVYASIADEAAGESRTVVVVVAPPESRTPSCAEIRRDFGLTKREAEVAVLLAARRSNKEIADHLCIANKTAWRHTERVLAKLNTSSRRDVGRVLLSGKDNGGRRIPASSAALAAIPA